MRAVMSAPPGAQGSVPGSMDSMGSAEFVGDSVFEMVEDSLLAQPAAAPIEPLATGRW
ncbi:MAG: hypothetical protein R3F43_28465 [bacterium]